MMKPLRHRMFVKHDPLYRSAGPVELPPSLEKARSAVGTVVAEQLDGADLRIFGERIEAGQRVIMNPSMGIHLGRKLGSDCDRVWEYRLEGSGEALLALLDSDAEVEGVQSGVERCAWCGAARGHSPNMLVMHGYCPRCKKDRQGNLRDDKAVSEEAVDSYMGQVSR